MTAPRDARRLCALGFTAFTFPAIMVLPRLGWLWATVAAAIAAVVIVLLAYLGRKNEKSVLERAEKQRWGRVALVMLFFWNIFAMGNISSQLCFAYPTAGNTPLTGLLLLLLAAYAAQKGSVVVLRMGAVLFFIVAAFYTVLLGVSIPDLRWNWLKPVKEVSWPFLVWAFAPIPAVFLCKGGEREKRLPVWLLGGVALSLLAALVCAGSLPPSIAAGNDFPFYVAAKSVSIFGVMERLEALVSAAVCVSGFCMLAMLCAVNGRLMRIFFPAPEKLTAICNLLLGGFCIWLSAEAPDWIMTIGITIFWVIMPIAIQGIVERKKAGEK